jgi:uncharacterized coiled-coil protein SlyX
MGYWNGTCGISQLPILSGKKVKMVLLLQSEFNQNVQGSGACHITHYFRPWFFPITAEYNGYGSIDNIDMDWNAKYMFERFREWLISGYVKILDNGECEVNSPNIDKFETLEDVFTCIERGALVTQNTGKKFDDKSQKWIPSGGYLKISMFMVLIPVWESLIIETNRFKNLSENSFYLEREIEDKMRFLKAVKKAISKIGGEKEMDKIDGCVYDYDLFGSSMSDYYNLNHYKPILYDPSKVVVEKFLEQMEEIKNVSVAMTYLRKLWFPQSGQGSQLEELSFNRALIDGMNKHIEDRSVEIEESRKELEYLIKKCEAEEKAKKTKKKKAKK